MGTNYYLHADTCNACGRSDAPRHIGKSSGGWCFALHVYPEDGIHDLSDWLKLIDAPHATIYDEYGGPVTPEQMRDAITKREGVRRSKPFGYESWKQLHEQNYSEPGPKELLRHKVGKYCLKHGEGTWDCITGEFS